MSATQGRARDAQALLVYELAQRSIQAQESKLDELRARSGTLIAAAAIVTSFLGGVAFDGKVGWLGWAAVGVFVVLMVLSVWIGLPVSWRFRPAARDVVKVYLEDADGPVSIAETRLGLADDMQGAERENDPKLSHRYWAFTAASVLLVVEIVLWMLEFAVR